MMASSTRSLLRPWLCRHSVALRLLKALYRWSSSGSSSSLYHCPWDDHPQVVDVTDLALEMRSQVRSYTQALSPEKVRLVGILARHGPYREDAEVYSERISETFHQDGIEYELCRCNGKQPADVARTIRQMNARADVHGILVFYPIFRETSVQKKGPYLNKQNGVYYKTYDDWLRDVVHPSKDVEGLCHDYNARWLFRARGKNRAPCEAYIPCTALAVMKILEAYHDFSPNSSPHQRWSGCTVTVVNRSEILGRPLAALLALEGATVYSVDDKSILLFKEGGIMRRCMHITLEQCLEESSIVVTGVPTPDFCLPSDSIGEGTTVVDVSEFSNVDEETLLQRPNVKLVPHVGKVTVAALEQNLVSLHKNIMQSCQESDNE